MIILAAAIILSLNNEKVISSANKAVEDTNLKQVQTQAELVWSDWYKAKMSGETTQTAEQYVIPKLEEELLDKYDIYDIIVTDDGVTVTKKTGGTTPVEKTAWNETKGLNAPVLREGMTAVKYDTITSKWVNVTEEEIAAGSWYDYTETSKNWANAKTSDGSYWVWIPRYEYKINEAPQSVASSSYGTINVNFVKTSITTATAGYTIHPAFRDESTIGFANGGWDSELDGIWVAKYDMSMEENGVAITTSSSSTGNVATSSTIKAVSKPGVSSWRNIRAANCYNNAKAYASNISLSTYDSHLMKNSEWGAVAYLTRSKYGTTAGRGTNYFDLNNNSSYITGGSARTSSTETVYGIYDLSGGANEYVAIFNASYSGSCYTYSNYLPVTGPHFASTGGTSTKYATAYTNTTSAYVPTAEIAKTGDATWEVYSSTANYAWNNDYAQILNTNSPLLTRGGFYGSNSNAGSFSAKYASGQSSAAIRFPCSACVALW